MSNVQTLVASKMSTTAPAAQPEQTRFMLVISLETREKLRVACEKLGVKQISFASELFTIALDDAIAAILANQA